MPFISIIVPIYNSKEYLPRCVDSVRNQDFADWELILVDDGSTDGSGALADTYRRDNIKVLHKENGGAASARQAGLQTASGEYVWFVDSDDAIEEDALSDICDELQDSHADILRFGYKIQNENRWRSELPPYRDGVYTAEALNSIMHEVLRYRTRILFTQCVQVFRRGLLEGIPFVSERTVMEEDKLFCILAAFRACSVQYLNDYLYLYYKRSNSLSTAHKPILQKCLNAYSFLRNSLQQLQVWDIYKADASMGFLLDSILGSGEKNRGAVLFEYYFPPDKEEAHANVRRALESEEISDMLENIRGTEIPEELTELYQIAKARDENALFLYLRNIALS